MKKIEIKIPGKTYPIFLGDGITNSFRRVIKSGNFCKNFFFVVDSNVFEYHGEKINSLISAGGGKSFVHVFESNERNKSFDGAQKIYSDLISHGFARDTLVVAVGGGITGDITGFVASTFMRGVQFVQIPTTLLSAVDSSVGGKTGINFEHTKNIIGTFFQPEFVFIDTEFLNTLPKDELVCGIGEILKYAFLSNDELFDALNNNLDKLLLLKPAFTKKIIETCIRFKGDVVAKDEKESGLRKILNFGHTFAHAFEVEQNYLLKHGQAVTVGIMCALELSRGLELISDKQFARFASLPMKLKDKIVVRNFNADDIYEIMKRDKKGTSDKIKFVLLNKLGRLLLDVTAEKAAVKAAIEKGAGYFVK